MLEDQARRIRGQGGHHILRLISSGQTGPEPDKKDPLPASRQRHRFIVERCDVCLHPGAAGRVERRHGIVVIAEGREDTERRGKSPQCISAQL
jgi:hypothetical protein